MPTILSPHRVNHSGFAYVAIAVANSSRYTSAAYVACRWPLPW